MKNVSPGINVITEDDEEGGDEPRNLALQILLII